MSLAIAMFLKPFMLLGLFVLVVNPLKRLAWRYLPDGKLKKVLFTRISDGDGQ